MAAVIVGAYNNRVAVATIATDSGTWGNDGGGGGVADEPDFFYEGTSAQSRKISTSEIGRNYTDSGTVDPTGTGTHQTFLFKINVTNYAALLSRTSPGTRIKIGSSSSAYQQYFPFGNDNYPAAGGWQFLPIDPNVAGYKETDQGSPTMTAVQYYSIMADFSSGSKGENVVIDAIDLGTGLRLTRGDAGSTEGTFADFLAADEGTSTGRWGYIRSLAGIYFVNGELAVGIDNAATPSSTITEFTDATGQVLVWENGFAATGYHAWTVDLNTSGTIVNVTSATFDSTGKLNNDANRGKTTTEDTRLLVQHSGTTGTATYVGCTFKNLSDFILTSTVDIDTCDIQTAAMTQGSADVVDSVIRTTSLANVATLDDPTFGTTTDLHDCEFIQSGTGHAIEITAAGAYTFTNLTFTGYNASDNNAASAIYCSAGSGTITINVSGGNTPSVRAPGMTIVKNNTVTVRVTVRDSSTLAPVSGARVYVTPLDNTDDLPFQEAVTQITRSATTATVSHTAHGMPTGSKVFITGADQSEYNGVFTISNVSANAYDYTVSGSPVSPATGTILATAVIIDGDTNGSGVVENTAFDFTNPQDLTGVVRKGTTSPLYKSGAVTGTVEGTGFSSTVLLVSDE